MSKLKHIFSFLKAWLKNPRSIGAVTPSSQYLAKNIITQIDRCNDGMILELGPGTGVFTRAMIQSGIPAKKIITIEREARFAKALKAQLPDITVIEGDATELSKLLASNNMKVGTIISSLPLLSINKKIRNAILDQILTVASNHCQFIQFTYKLKIDTLNYPKTYSLKNTFITWRNLPPARVLVFDIEKNQK